MIYFLHIVSLNSVQSIYQIIRCLATGGLTSDTGLLIIKVSGFKEDATLKIALQFPGIFGHEDRFLGHSLDILADINI